LGEAGLLHQLIQPNGVHAALSEKLGSCGNDRATVFRSLFSRHPQSLILELIPPVRRTLAHYNFIRNRQSRLGPWFLNGRAATKQPLHAACG
jgi:hypothetical protein